MVGENGNHVALLVTSIDTDAVITGRGIRSVGPCAEAGPESLAEWRAIRPVGRRARPRPAPVKRACGQLSSGARPGLLITFANAVDAGNQITEAFTLDQDVLLEESLGAYFIAVQNGSHDIAVLLQ